MNPPGRHSLSEEVRPRANVWVIEDDVMFRKGIEGVLNRARGITCQHAFGNAEAALDEMKADDVPQIILMDIGLPGMSGIDALRAIRGISPSTPIIILTIYDDDAKVFDAICAGASGYLLKTSSGKEIVQGIKQVLDGGASMSAQIARRVLEMFPRVQAPHPEYHITEREQEILRLLVDGKSTKEIAVTLSVSYYTIDTHLKNIYVKLHVHSGTGAVSKALREHLV